MKGPLNDTYIQRLPTPPKSAEVLRVLLNVWIKFKENPFLPETVNKRTRKFQYDAIAGAYNTVAAIFLSGKYTEKLFIEYLFNDREGNKMWEKIVDCGTDLFFPVVKEFSVQENEQSTRAVKKNPDSDRKADVFNPFGK